MASSPEGVAMARTVIYCDLDRPDAVIDEISPPVAAT
jgi:hypothetical protein